jgi:coenzyme PQQ precursor peptide PqqA
MTWATPTIMEICIGLEINGYLPAEFLIVGDALKREDPDCIGWGPS